MKQLADGAAMGGYRIVGQLGRGGMATVYRAHQPSLDRFVAVKVLHDAGAEDASFRDRFTAEARLVAHLQHPNIVQVYDFGEQDGALYIVMELVEGSTLRDQIAGPMPAGRALDILSQIAAALDYAHANGVVHRDIKPANVLIDAEGRALLTDFGIARMLLSTADLTREHASVGTPEYMSPEQAAAKPDLGPAADLYSLGIMAQQLLTGQLPFQADSPLAVLHAHIHKPPPPASLANPALPAPVDAVLAKALAKHPSERFGGATEFVNELRSVLEGDEGATMLTAVYTPPAPPRRVSRGNPFSLVIAGGLAVLLLLVMWFGGRLALQLSPLRLIGLFSHAAPSRPASAGPSLATPGSSQFAVAPPSVSAAIAAPTSPAPSSAAAGSPEAPPLAGLPTPVPTPLPTAPPSATPVDPNPDIHSMTSTDGVHFTNNLALPDVRGNLLSVLPAGPGQLRLYASDLQALRLKSWKGDPSGKWAAEPTDVQSAPAGMVYGSVVQLPDGAFRLYYLGQNGPFTPGDTAERLILSAKSQDGVKFLEEQGVRYKRPAMKTLTATQSPNGWLILFNLQNNGLTNGARSQDGLDFIPEPNIAINVSGVQVTNYDGQFHFLVHASERLLSFASADGSAWKLAQDIDAPLPPGTGMSAGAIIRGTDGQYRLFFTWVRFPSSPR